MSEDYLNLNFSHKGFVKLDHIDTDAAVVLLEVFYNQKKYLGNSFVKYDATYIRADGQKGKYEIASEKVIVLLFMDRNGRIFTDVRPHTQEKLRYYSRSKGRLFKINFPTV